MKEKISFNERENFIEIIENIKRKKGNFPNE